MSNIRSNSMDNGMIKPIYQLNKTQHSNSEWENP
jgi:hypothetical protein